MKEDYVSTEEDYRVALKAVEIVEKLKSSLEDIEVDRAISYLYHRAYTPIYLDKTTGKTHYKQEIEDSVEKAIASVHAILVTVGAHFRFSLAGERLKEIRQAIEADIETMKKPKYRLRLISGSKDIDQK